MTETRLTIIDGGRAIEMDERRGAEHLERAARAGRPVAVDADEHVAYLGVPASQRAAALASLEAPDFTLPDLEGRPHSLAEQRGKKVLLVAYGSW